ncbi:MAG: nuclear transport factor 2 family protein [Bacteroidota bacterium]
MFKTNNRQQPATAVKKIEVYEVQDQTASGKVTAWWGTDYILLAKVSNQWMIRAVLWQGPLKK